MAKLNVELTPVEAGVVLAGILNLYDEGLLPGRLLDTITDKFETALKNIEGNL
jgi:hypothetical protein